MISSFGFDEKKDCLKDMPINKYKEFISKKGNLLWVDIEAPSEDDYKILSDVFNFHPLAIEDVRKVIELPKIDEYDDYIFIVFHRVAYDFKLNKFVLKEIDFFLGEDFLVSIHNEPSPAVNGVKDICFSKAKLVSKDVDFILHGILDQIIDQYFPIIDSWDEEIDEVEEIIISEKTVNVLERLMKMKRQIIELRRSISPQRDVIGRLARGGFPFISEKAGFYFRDIYDHILRVNIDLENHRDLIAGAFEAYVTIISNKMAEISNRMNAIMQRLTIIATIFMPLTFLASIYGMNFRFIPELEWKYGFYVILLVMLIIGILMYLFFKKKKWV